MRSFIDYCGLGAIFALFLVSTLLLVVLSDLALLPPSKVEEALGEHLAPRSFYFVSWLALFFSGMLATLSRGNIARFDIAFQWMGVKPVNFSLSLGAAGAAIIAASAAAACNSTSLAMLSIFGKVILALLIFIAIFEGTTNPSGWGGEKRRQLFGVLSMTSAGLAVIYQLYGP